MQAHVLRGTKQQIAENLARMPGEIREAIVFVEETASAGPRMLDREDLFAEMRPYMVDVEELDAEGAGCEPPPWPPRPGPGVMVFRSLLTSSITGDPDFVPNTS